MADSLNPLMTTSRWTRLIALAAAAAACTTDTGVGPRGVTALDVVPATGEVVLDRTFQLQAVARDSDGVSYVGLPVTWTSSDPAVGSWMAVYENPMKEVVARVREIVLDADPLSATYGKLITSVATDQINAKFKDGVLELYATFFADSLPFQ